jgi:ATP-dependent Clp protease ATP-binding subunit ClpC
MKNVVDLGFEQMHEFAHENLAPDHVFLALLIEGQRPGGIGHFVLTQLGVDVDSLRRELTQFLDSEESRLLVAGLFKGFLTTLGTDITEKVYKGLVDPVIGRDVETFNTILGLCRRRKSNPCLLGEPGVGKSAVAEGLAQRIIAGDVPENLQGCLVVSIDIGVLVAGTRYRGMFESRLKGIINECKEIKNIIILIDEIHTLIGSGAAEGAADAANLLKPALARGDFKCLGATTLAEYKKYIEKDAALERRFCPVIIPEPSVEETVEILWGLRAKYQSFHRVTISFASMYTAASLGKQFIGDRFLPDKAIDLIDEAGSRYCVEKAGLPEPAKVFDRELVRVLKTKNKAIRRKNFEEAEVYQYREDVLRIRRHAQWMNHRNKKGRKLKKDIIMEIDIAGVVADWTGVPVQQISASEAKRLKKMKTLLQSKIVGQPAAINAVTRAIRRSRVGLQEKDRPIAALLFSGPTGTGKTELAKVVARYFFGVEGRLIRFDMSEFMEKYAVSKLIGAPPGYLGHSDGGKLTNEVRRQPNSLVLFDELEKAHPKIYNIMLQIFDEGYVTCSKGRCISFRSALVVVTANAGAYAVTNYCALNPSPEQDKDPEGFKKYHGELQEISKAQLKKVFRPEFLNRLDEIVVFQSLQMSAVQKIAEIMLDRLTTRAKRSYSFSLFFHDNFKAMLADRGFDPAYGARPLRRAVTKLVEDVITDCVMKGLNWGCIIWDVTENGMEPYIVHTAEPPTVQSTRVPVLRSYERTLEGEEKKRKREAKRNLDDRDKDPFDSDRS